MKYKFIISDAAQLDYEEIIYWYSDSSSLIAERFRQNLKKSVKYIVSMPFASQMIAPDVRQHIIHKFPYKVIYTVENNEIVVVAIVHQKRSPIVWENRITKH